MPWGIHKDRCRKSSEGNLMAVLCEVGLSGCLQAGPRPRGPNGGTDGGTDALTVGRNCFAFLRLEVHPSEGCGLAVPARLEGLELVEGLVHLPGEVRLVARYLLEVFYSRQDAVTVLSQ